MMKTMIFFFVSWLGSYSLAQNISEGVLLYYTHSHSDYSPEFINKEGIAQILKVTRNLVDDSTTHQKVMEVHDYSKSGHPVRSMIGAPYYATPDSTTIFFSYDSLERLTERKLYRLSKPYQEKYVLAERELYYYNEVGIVKYVKMEMIDRRQTGSGVTSFRERLMITRADSISYLSDSSAQLFSNTATILIPDSLAGIESNLSYTPYENYDLTYNGDILRVRHNSNPYQRRINKFGHILYDTETAWLKYIQSEWDFDQSIPRELQPLLDGSNSIQYTNKIPDWNLSKDDKNFIAIRPPLLTDAFISSHRLEVDTLRRNIYLYKTTSSVQYTSGPNIYSQDSSITVFNANLLPLKTKTNHHSQADAWGYNGHPTENFYQNSVTYHYYPNGIPRLIRREYSQDFRIKSEDKFEIVYF